MRRTLLFLACLMTLVSCKPSYQSDSRFIFATVCTIQTKGNKDLSQVWDRLYELEGRISSTIDTSEICKLEEQAGKAYVELSEDTYLMLELSLRLSELSQGSFDISIDKVSELWQFGSTGQRLPEDGEIKSALEYVDYKSIEIKEEDGRYWGKLDKEGMRISLGSIGKGYAADLAKNLLLQMGIESALLDFGGNIYCLGSYYNQDWRIGLQEPSQSRGTYSQVVNVQNKSVVTSGVYERCFTQDGVLYHHILDAHTGYSATSDYRAVSIIGPSSTVCDGLSTTCFILGKEKSRTLLQSFEDYEAIFLE